MLQKIKNILPKIKNEKPLILNITNAVTMDFIANGLLSLGASPVMSKAHQEMDDLIQLASAVVINLGTLDEKFIVLCEEVCRIANELKKPIVLDPVGAGASRYRTETNFNLINKYKMAIIRGNASEIMSLAGVSMKTKGVDSTAQSDFAIESAQSLSMRHDAAIVVSGKTDIIVDGNHMQQLHYGSPLMPQITGTGCLLTAVVAAFHAVEKNRFDASVLATAFYGLCGEKAAKSAQGPASFKIQFLDQLNLLPDEHSLDEKS